MEQLELAQVAADIAWRIAGAADQDAFRRIYHRFNTVGPDPRFEHTASGFMLAIRRNSDDIGDFLTPWGRWRVVDTPMTGSIYSKVRIDELLAEFGCQLVPHDNLAYMSQWPWGHRGGAYNLYALTQFGDIELPLATGTPGLGKGWAAQYAHLLSSYPDDYPEYWARRREWVALCAQLNPSPRSRCAEALALACLAHTPS